MENDNLIRKPFETKRTQEEMDKDKSEIINIRLNSEERDMLDQAKITLQQEKDSTALKQLAMIGYQFVLQDKKTLVILDYIINNKRRNQRLGIIETESKFNNYMTNVTQNIGVSVTQMDKTP